VSDAWDNPVLLNPDTDFPLDMGRALSWGLNPLSGTLQNLL